MTKGFDHRDDRNDGLLLTCCLIAVTNHLDSREWTYTIMHTYYPFSIIRNQGKTMLYRMETRLSTVCHLVFNLEVIFLAELFPIVLLCLR